jgi:hypothetical protein
MSVVIEKCLTEYQEAANVTTIAAAMTHQAKCTQKPIVRTTKKESAFMGCSGEGRETGRRLRLQDNGKKEAGRRIRLPVDHAAPRESDRDSVFPL